MPRVERLEWCQFVLSLQKVYEVISRRMCLGVLWNYAVKCMDLLSLLWSWAVRVVQTTNLEGITHGFLPWMMEGCNDNHVQACWLLTGVSSTRVLGLRCQVCFSWISIVPALMMMLNWARSNKTCLLPTSKLTTHVNRYRPTTPMWPK